MSSLGLPFAHQDLPAQCRHRQKPPRRSVHAWTQLVRSMTHARVVGLMPPCNSGSTYDLQQCVPLAGSAMPLHNPPAPGVVHRGD
eukprot:8539019-Karenia_brevis.AAC.1